MMSENGLILALPKGRLLEQLLPLMVRAGIEPEPEFHDRSSRRLSFKTNMKNLTLIRVRSFDVATFVAFGGAQLGVTGQDTLLEFDYPEVYAPLDLKIGCCRLSLAEPTLLAAKDDPSRWSHVRVATKYPQATKRHFATRGVHAECIKLSGAVELAPLLGLCHRIVDLVESGETLRANGLVEVELLTEVSARLIVNRAAWKTQTAELDLLVDSFRRVIDGEKN
tara:strand:+ start:888 stop:1556 length:669 start_codon:yes stop_codon:yes gene_type:complete